MKWAGVILGGSLALIGAMFGNVPLVIFGFLVAMIAGVVLSMRAMQDTRSELEADDLSPESRTLLVPIRRLRDEIQEIAGRSSAVSQFLAKEAVAESQDLYRRVKAALHVRDRVVRESRGEYEARKGLAEIESQAGSALSDAERESLSAAKSLREQELAHYETLKQVVPRIDSAVRQAQAALSELRARLGTASVDTAGTEGDELRDAMGRVRSLSTTLDEVQELRGA